MRLKFRLNQAVKRPPQDRSWNSSEPSSAGPCSPCPPGIALRNFEQNRGITVIATTNEASNARQNAAASAENKNLLTPNNNVTGKKSTTSTRVAASTARFTSAPPCSAATAGAEPISKCR